ncbi:MAG: DUF1553 domain-containing protein [Planctomycetaceae bacterium]|nr:DUF1553 domain-containing protein [Planctomycetaceae bacterium]
MKQIIAPMTMLVVFGSGFLHAAETLDTVLAAENKDRGVTQVSVGKIDDMAYLRRVSVDLIGRIPTIAEVDEYLAWPQAKRRELLVDKLVASDRFADRWTVFFADLLRLRSNVTGGSALIAYVHQAIQNDLPYNQLASRLIATNGKAGRVPEVGFILGDNADPLAMASVTSQVFLGVRIGCAQCHDHPFDKWTRKDFYSVAAYFGKTRRYESNFTRAVYTSEGKQTTVLWPPEDEADPADRQALTPSFPFTMMDKKAKPAFIVRYEALLQERAAKKAASKGKGPSLDALLADADKKVTRATRGDVDLGQDEARKEINKINIKDSLYRPSEYREQLAALITSPRNRYFSEAFVNRVWKELVGRGFVEPVDDFRADNPASHPRTLGLLADNFVASGFSFRQLVRTIIQTDAYQLKQVPRDVTELVQEELEAAFLATPMRRMYSESLYDSIVTAGHLFDVKYTAGQNERVIEQEIRVLLGGEDKTQPVAQAIIDGAGEGDTAEMKKMKTAGTATRAGYKLEEAIELDFAALLKPDDEVKIDRMQVKTAEELEAERMAMERVVSRPGMKYETKIVKRTIDDNPRFSSSLRMASPAPIGHFVRVFGQTSRNDLGEARNQTPSMRQALMMLNGRLTHEASRVGDLEPIHKYLAGKQPRLDQAVKFAYREILTREPSADEMANAMDILQGAKTATDGMADLRWVLLNSNEFRFLP